MTAGYGREPVTLVELVQPRCSLRFGVAPCAATGTPKCYNTWQTCRDRNNIDTGGSITWRFRRPDAGIWPLYSESGDNIETNPLPLLVSASATSAQISLGAQREGQSPLGIRGTVEVVLQDAPFDDHVGDYYLADRSSVQGSFWSKWRARNAFYIGMMIRVYDGYRGEALSAMQRRDYVFDTIAGPDAGGRVTITGKDPLRLAEVKEALFPRPTEIRAVVNKEYSATADLIRVACDEVDLSEQMGNHSAARRFVRFGSEVLQYSSYTEVSPGLYDLTIAQRGALGTTAAKIAKDAVGQRCGKYDDVQLWIVAGDLIDNWTTIPAGYRDNSQWAEEGDRFLATQRTNRCVTQPTSVAQLLGELCQQGGFSLWWDERARKIPLLPNRPPQETPMKISDDLDILAGSSRVEDDPDAQVSRVYVRYDPLSATDTGDDNYRRARIHIDGFVEDAAAAGAVRTLEVRARWLHRDADVLQLAARLLLRYRLVPKYLEIELDARQRATAVGDVLDITTQAFVTSEGAAEETRWQVVKWEEVPGASRFKLRLQSYTYLGRFSKIMENDANSYATATAAELENGCYMAENTGVMPDGGEPYLFQ